MVPPILGVTRSSSKAITTQALWGVGAGGGGALFVIVVSIVGSAIGNAVAHAVHKVDVMPAFCPPAPSRRSIPPRWRDSCLLASKYARWSA